MNLHHSAVVLAIALVGCGQQQEGPAGNGAGAEATTGTSADGEIDAEELKARAQAAIGNFKSAGAAAITETAAPFRISAVSLTGKEPFPWGTDSWELQVVAAHAEEPTPRATMQFLARSGRMLVNLPPANGFHYYVECDVRMSAPGMQLRWDALMNQTGPVNGVATLDPATKRYYFATPAAGTTPQNRVFFTIDTQTGNPPPDAHWMLHGCDVLPFK